MTEDTNTRDEARLYSLKNTIKRMIKKREDTVINKLVFDYRNGNLTERIAHSAIMVIAELRSAEGDLGKEDL